jgi:hypothetical protein
MYAARPHLPLSFRRTSLLHMFTLMGHWYHMGSLVHHMIPPHTWKWYWLEFEPSWLIWHRLRVHSGCLSVYDYLKSRRFVQNQHVRHTKASVRSVPTHGGGGSSWYSSTTHGVGWEEKITNKEFSSEEIVLGNLVIMKFLCYYFCSEEISECSEWTSSIPTMFHMLVCPPLSSEDSGNHNINSYQVSHVRLPSS